MTRPNGPASLSTLAQARSGRRMRASSYDRTGGNDDRLHVQPGATSVLAVMDRPGLVTHLWVTITTACSPVEKNYLRKIVLRMFWDGEALPSVEAPIGDFFGMGHARSRNFVSAPLQMSPEDGKGFNCWFPMPYEKARIEVLNECDSEIKIYYYVDYEEYDELPADLLRFHAVWNRECPTEGIPDEGMENAEFCFGGTNTTGDGNYVLLEAEGRGHYVGCNVNIHNLRDTSRWDWPGEGDDMFFIDGEPWPPRLHGTGTEDYFDLAWCPTQEYNAPYHGIILPGDDNWKGFITYYRYHVQDPVMFDRSIRVTLEHGHANRRSDDWSSTAYWYQTEPHRPLPPFPGVDGRMPLEEEIL